MDPNELDQEQIEVFRAGYARALHDMGNKRPAMYADDVNVRVLPHCFHLHFGWLDPRSISDEIKTTVPLPTAPVAYLLMPPTAVKGLTEALVVAMRRYERGYGCEVARLGDGPEIEYHVKGEDVPDKTSYSLEERLERLQKAYATGELSEATLTDLAKEWGLVPWPSSNLEVITGLAEAGYVHKPNDVDYLSRGSDE